MCTETTTQQTRDAQIQAARESFSGRTLTDSQLREATAITDVIRAEIEKSGSFVEKLADYSHAFARNDNFNAMRGEKIIRDIYSARFGQSMNQTREALIKAQDTLPVGAPGRALARAESICAVIQAPPTQPFYRAYDRAAVSLANEFGVTQAHAKTMMKEAYHTVHGRDLYEAGKEVEAAYHTPVREAEIATRKAEKLQSRSPSQSRSQSMS